MEKPFKDDYRYLATYHSEHFDMWFDKDTYPREYYKYLAMYCSDHFLTWFDNSIFPKDKYYYLSKYCLKYYQIWELDAKKRIRRINKL